MDVLYSVVRSIEVLIENHAYGAAIDLCNGILGTRVIAEDVRALGQVMQLQEHADRMRRGEMGFSFRSAWSWLPPLDHVGQVWVGITTATDKVGAENDLVVQWGPLVRYVTLKPLDTEPIYLVFQKIHPDQVPLSVRCGYACHVEFGVESTPTQMKQVDLNDGWTLTDEVSRRE